MLQDVRLHSGAYTSSTIFNRIKITILHESINVYCNIFFIKLNSPPSSEFPCSWGGYPGAAVKPSSPTWGLLCSQKEIKQC